MGFSKSPGPLTSIEQRYFRNLTRGLSAALDTINLSKAVPNPLASDPAVLTWAKLPYLRQWEFVPNQRAQDQAFQLQSMTIKLGATFWEADEC